MHVIPERPLEFTLKLRVPHWSGRTSVTVNGKPLPDVAAGRYVAVRQTWRRGDQISIDLDMSPRYWAGERECAGKVSLYRGPLLLAHEPAEGASVPPLDVAHVDVKAIDADAGAIVMIDVQSPGGETIRLRDYGSAGRARRPYVTWLPAKNAVPTPFSRPNPQRTRPLHAGS